MEEQAASGAWATLPQQERMQRDQDMRRAIQARHHCPSLISQLLFSRPVAASGSVAPPARAR